MIETEAREIMMKNIRSAYKMSVGFALLQLGLYNLVINHHRKIMPFLSEYERHMLKAHLEVNVDC